MSEDKYDARATSRLLAVQALYQMDIAQTPLEVVIREFQDHRVENPLDGTEMPSADADYFEFVLRGVMDFQTKIDRTIDGYLAENWRLARLDSTLRAILRCGVCELLGVQKAPAGVIVSQYTDIAHAFFDGAEGGMTNALLDRVAKALDEGAISSGF
ncbi:transcription antitermination factor NusB [Alphaproteobacteria bacterium]|nr:transcription antitermination factor NusB [Alphaproteobacteria bacterium]MDB2668890.1 transcription antitermination factor NusB [Alphaproteobacteria bacterium]MDC0147701.1 transcription antitermination factor NusB [Alphaproteobacteria bacterium]